MLNNGLDDIFLAPIASIVTIQPLSSKELINNGIAVISLLLSSTFT